MKGGTAVQYLSGFKMLLMKLYPSLICWTSASSMSKNWYQDIRRGTKKLLCDLALKMGLPLEDKPESIDKALLRSLILSYIWYVFIFL